MSPIDPDTEEVTLEPCEECGPDYLCEISADGTTLNWVYIGQIEILAIEEVPFE